MRLATATWPNLPSLADRIEELISSKIVMLPVQWLGHSPHHRRFGRVSLELMPYVEMIRGMGRSLVAIGARKILPTRPRE